MDVNEADFWAAHPGLQEEIRASMTDRSKRRPRPVRPVKPQEEEK
jgi:hypothetical protein